MSKLSDSKSALSIMRWSTALGALVLFMDPFSCLHAYEVRTHEALTLAAFEGSVLADATQGPLAALGIVDLTETSLRSIPPPDIEPELTSARGLVGFGAIYEDHPDPRNWPSPPQLEWRFNRHFFDPQQEGKGLSGLWSSSPAWALESEEISEQAFSLRDAMQSYLLALTLSDRQSRRHQTVLLLQSIGRAVHHLQDMAQPAHVRDDAHLPFPLDDDRYERYTSEQFDDQRRPLPSVLSCGEAPVDLRVFDEARKFWHNEGRGVAEFTSRNFLSEDTNFFWAAGWRADIFHPSPSYPAVPTFEDVTLGELGISHPFPNTPVRFLQLPIEGGCLNTRASTQSFLFQDLQALVFPGYSLNGFNFEENCKFLFPRAIAYSTGLINYFFRGRLELESYTNVDSLVEIVVRNESAAEFALSDSAEEGAEEFSLWYDSQSGERRRLALTNDELGGDLIEHGQTWRLSFRAPLDVDFSNEKPFVLVFDGTTGKEPGIAALAIGPRQGSFLVTPSYAVADGVSGARVIAQVEGTLQVTSQSGAVAGNIDWRGHDPDEVLTWDGPRSRYFGERPGISPRIYQGGKVLSVAPDNVIGAAISKQGSQRYLIAAVGGWSAIKIYRRPYQSSYSKDGLFHALNNPIGWQLIHTENGFASSPMFFNASGTEGQVFSGVMTRYKMNIAGATVTVTKPSNVGTIRSLFSVTHDSTGSVEAMPPPTPQSCSASGTTCIGERGTCTDPNTGTPYGNVCLVEQSQEESSYGTVSVSHRKRENVTSTVVCADYNGDTEVLCLIEADETLHNGKTDSTGQWRSTQTYTRSGVCTPQVSGSAEYLHEYNVVEDSSDIMMLRIGSVSVPLSGSLRQVEKHYDSRAGWDWGSSEPLPTVDFVRETNDTEYDAKLLYVDARHEIVVYEEHVRNEHTLGSGSTEARRRSYPQDYAFDANSQTTEQSTSRMIVRADREYVLSRHTVEEEPAYPSYSEITGFPYVGIIYCNDDPPYTQHDDRTDSWDPDRFYVNSLHPKIDEATQSISAVSSNNFVASVPIWIRQSDGSYKQDGVWNHVSGANLAALLPLAPPGATYSPTGIVK